MPTKKTAKKPVAKKAVKKTPTKKVAVKKAIKKTTAKKAVKKTTAKKTVKKLAVKKVVKKAATKKASMKVKKSLVYANEQTSFWLKNGQILNSLIALRDSLNEMENEVYLYHAKGTHNDFANWVGAVLADSKCASDLEKAKTRSSAKTVVVRHLKFYTT